MEKASIVEKLRYQRKRKGLTQEQLSDLSGVAVRTIQRIENEKVAPHRQTLTLLAEPLALEVQDLAPISAPDAEAAEGKWLLLLHLLPIAGLVIPFANLVLPFVLWAYKRGEHPEIDKHGRAVVNFQLTVTLLFMIGVVLLVLYFVAGLVLLVLTVFYIFLLVLRNTLRVFKNKIYTYPLSLKIL